jgi:uncharacterized protein YoxC
MSENMKSYIPEQVREGLKAAEERFAEFEKDAERVLNQLIERGRAQRKELGEMIQKVAGDGKELVGKAEAVRSDVEQRLQVLQKRVLHVAGVATREQVSRLSRELDKLGKKVEKLAKKRSKHGEQSAAQQ